MDGQPRGNGYMLLFSERLTTYLFHQFPATDNDGWTGVVQFVIITTYVAFLQIAGHDELKFPSTFFPQIIQTGYPTPCRIRR